MRPQRSRKEPMARNSFVRCHATKSLSQGPGSLCSVSGPHLQETIGKSRLENSASDRSEGHLISQICPLPDLFFAALKGPKRLRFFGAVANAAVGTENLNPPGIRFAGRHSLHLQSHWDISSIDLHIGV